MFLEQRAKDLGSPPIEPPVYDRRLMVRIQFLVRLESLINIGCKFGPNDLPARVWDELLALALERSFMDRLVDQRRGKQQQEDRAIGKARQQSGVPAPGQTIFEHSRPFVR